VNVAVDLHCHILPGIDDGAVDLDDAVAMAVRVTREPGSWCRRMLGTPRDP
jgi:tyrosine-protein phosphatase YwqE